MKKVVLLILLVTILIISCFALSSCTPKYDIVWLNWDGSILEGDYDVEEGEMPRYDGLTPTKPGDEQYSYEFCGWDEAITPASASTSYIAQFSPVLNKYNVVWRNWDGTVLQESRVEYGQTPVYTGETPTKDSSEEYNYIFTDWSPTVNVVTGDIDYTAQYTEEIRKYTITWLNWDGSVLAVDQVEYYSYPYYYGETPTKEGNDEFYYVFDCWSPSRNYVTEDATYTAMFSTHKREYLVTWVDWDGRKLESCWCEYGTMPEYSEWWTAPYRPNTEQYAYTFAGWSPTIDVVTGDITYVAQYTSELRKYTVKWTGWDGTVLETDENVEYGTMPSYDGETPTRDATASTVYIFTGWSPCVDVVTGDVTYRAQFVTEATKFTVTWTNWDGTVLEVDEGVPYGTKPSYDGATPTKMSDVEFSYEFSGWSPWVSSVREDVTFVANYTQKTNTYKVTWKNWDGTVIKTDEVQYGTTPSYVGEKPTKENTTTEAFDFAGWDKPIVSVEGDQTYVAVFNSVRIFQVKYNLAGGTASGIADGYKRIGTYLILTDIVPTRDGYRFLGWNTVNESRVYAPGEYFYGDFDVEFYALWERYELCSTCTGNGYVSETCTDCDGKGEWDERCNNHDEGYRCPRCGTKYNFIVINGIGHVCSTCYVTPTYTPCERCGGDKSIHKTCSSCDWQGYINVTCPTCEGGRGTFEESPSLSYKTTSKVALAYIAGYEYSMDGKNWQVLPLFENLLANTEYTFYQRRASTETVPFGPTSPAFTVTTDDYYTITYVLNGGEGHSNSEKYRDNSQIVLSLAYKTGYTSLGWYDADGNKVEVVGDGMCGDIVLYARWNDGNQYTVSFRTNSADCEIEPITVQYGKEYTLPTPTKIGYTFEGWWYFPSSGGSRMEVASQGMWKVASDMEYFAVWDTIEYKISYVLDGGTSSNRTYYTIEYYTFTLSAPTRTGYTFAGWTYEGQDTPVFEVTIEEGSMGDREFTAHWTANPYTITLDANGGEVEKDTLGVVFDGEYTLPTPTRQGYTFLGWFVGAKECISGVWTQASDATFVAKWKANTYTVTYKDTAAIYGSDLTVTFDYNYNGSSNKVKVLGGEILSRPANPTRSGYIFTGWYTDSSCTRRYEFNSTIGADLTLYAGWLQLSLSNVYSSLHIDPTSYSSSLNAYSTSTNSTSPTSVKYLYLVVQESGIHNIYWKNFSTGWGYYLQIYNLTTEEYIQESLLTSSIEYQCCSFACEAGDVIVISFNRSDKLSYNSEAAAYFYFSGFGSAKASTAVARPVSDIIYSPGSYYEEKVEFDENYTVPAPNRYGYNFGGWYNIDEEVESGIWGYATDVTLVPCWEVGTYTVALDPNGADIEEVSVDVTYGQEYTLPLPTRTGYTFVGWFGVEREFAGGIWDYNADVTLVAKWTANTYNVKYEDIVAEYRETRISFNYDSTSIYKTITLTDGEMLNYPAPPTMAGYAFVGWYTDISCTNKYDFSGEITEDFTLYAGWIEMEGSYKTRQYVDIANYGSDSSKKTISITAPYSSETDLYYFTCYTTGSYTLSASYTSGDFYIYLYNATTGEFISSANLYSSNRNASFTFEANAGDVMYISLYKYNSGAASGSGSFYVTNSSYPTSTAICYSTQFFYDEKSSYEKTAAYDDNFRLPTPTRPNHNFLGWYNGEEKVESGLWKIASDVVLVAKWERVEYEITYDLGGGTNAPTNPSSYSKNDVITLAQPTRLGYTFLGWTGSNGGVPELVVTFSGEDFIAREYIANWEVTVFNVEYVMDGGSNPSKNPTAITILDTFELKDPTRTGYTFEGWYIDAEFTSVISTLTNVTSDITLYARFVPNKYSATFISDPVDEKITITLNHGEGVNKVTYHTITRGSTFNPYEHIVSHNNYIFGGWYLTSSFSRRVSGDVVLYEDTTFYAERIYVSGTYDKLPTDGKAIVVTQTYSTSSNCVAYYVPDNACRIYIRTEAYYGYSAYVERWREGYGYDRYLTYVTSSADSSAEVEGYFDVWPGDVLYFYNSCFKNGSPCGRSVVSVVETYSATVSFGPYSTSKTISYDSAIPDYSILGSGCATDRTGYRFVGWADEDGVMCGENWNFLENKVFYAQWELIDYTIKYNLDGGENSPYNPGHYNVSESITLKNATKTGYTFLGWYLDSEFTEKVTSIKNTTGNYTLYAKFTPNSYTADLEYDGGTSSPTVTFVSDGESVDMLLTGADKLPSYYPPAKEGYIFAGWYLDEGCQNVFNFSKVITDDLTLYAKWISSDTMCHKITVNETEIEKILINGTNEIRITFVPLTTGQITISTSSQLDVKGILYNENMVKVAEADDISDENYNFSITYTVEAGKQYTVAIKGATTLTVGDCDVLFGFDGSMGISGTTYTHMTFDIVYDAMLILPVPTKEGYVFLGWFDENGNQVTSSTWTYALDTTLYARWYPIEG